MVDHIYGRVNLLNDVFRPNCFINELELYIDYFKKEFQKFVSGVSTKNSTYFQTFKKNLSDGIDYYESLYEKVMGSDIIFPKSNIQLLKNIKTTVNQLVSGVELKSNFSI